MSNVEAIVQQLKYTLSNTDMKELSQRVLPMEAKRANQQTLAKSDTLAEVKT